MPPGQHYHLAQVTVHRPSMSCSGTRVIAAEAFRYGEEQRGPKAPWATVGLARGTAEEEDTRGQ